MSRAKSSANLLPGQLVMADALGTAASIIAVIQLAQVVLGYINDVKGASEDRNMLLVEISTVNGLLYSLSDLASRSSERDSWISKLRALQAPNGPLSQFESALATLAEMLKPVHGIRKVGKALTWPFQHGEIKDILSTIERQKSLFSLALQQDHM